MITEWPLSMSINSSRAATTSGRVEGVGFPSSEYSSESEGAPRIAKASPTSRWGTQSRRPVSEIPMRSRWSFLVSEVYILKGAFGCSFEGGLNFVASLSASHFSI